MLNPQNNNNDDNNDDKNSTEVYFKGNDAFIVEFYIVFVVKWVCTPTMVDVWRTEKTSILQFSPPTFWILSLEVNSSGLEAFTWTITQAPGALFWKSVRK